MEIIDCKVNGKSFSLDVDDEPSPEIQEVADIMETRSSARTTRESRTSLYKCKDEKETGQHRSCVHFSVDMDSPSTLVNTCLHIDLS